MQISQHKAEMMTTKTRIMMITKKIRTAVMVTKTKKMMKKITMMGIVQLKTRKAGVNEENLGRQW